MKANPAIPGGGAPRSARSMLASTGPAEPVLPSDELTDPPPDVPPAELPDAGPLPVHAPWLELLAAPLDSSEDGPLVLPPHPATGRQEKTIPNVSTLPIPETVAFSGTQVKEVLSNGPTANTSRVSPHSARACPSTFPLDGCSHGVRFSVMTSSPRCDHHPFSGDDFDALRYGPPMRLAIAGALILSVGCSGKTSADSAPGSVTGTVGGNAIPTTSVVAISQGAGRDSAVAVVFVNNADACSLLQSNRRPGNLADLELSVGAAGGPTAGTYTITPGIGGVATASTFVDDAGAAGDEGGAATTSGSNVPLVTATFGQTDVNCMTTTYDTASSGSITLTTVSSSEVAGSFDVTFPSGDHLTGTFDAPVCTVPTTSTTTTCGG
jgi:hypothetical protein